MKGPTIAAINEKRKQDKTTYNRKSIITNKSQGLFLKKQSVCAFKYSSKQIV